MLKKISLFGLLFFVYQSNFGQLINTELPDTISYWSKENKVGLDISQITFVNWNAGGNNSISGLPNFCLNWFMVAANSFFLLMIIYSIASAGSLSGCRDEDIFAFILLAKRIPSYILLNFLDDSGLIFLGRYRHSRSS